MKPRQLERLDVLQAHPVAPGRVCDEELAGQLCEWTRDTGRQLGVLLDRRGRIEQVVVGDASRLVLPDLGRARSGETRLRGLRLVHTHFADEPLTPDDLTDLSVLRLDVVCAIETRGDGSPGWVHVAYLDPHADERTKDPWWVETVAGVAELELDPVAKAEEIESALARRARPREVRGTPRAILVAASVKGRRADASMAELWELARTAGIEVVDRVVQARDQIDPRFVIGQGKLEELERRAMQLSADMLVFDHDLTPAQARHIADRVQVKVLDRTQLILDIFAQRARSAEGKLQVELAQLRYRLPRLAQRDEGLSRLTGGIGGRGPGETKLEIDRRRVRDRIRRLEKRIDELGEKRQVLRQRRGRHEVPVLAIVGYTNAGKSTLLNALTKSAVFVEHKLFATLDPTSRRLRFPRDREVVVTDTVGFIRDLPETLQSAFRATLEELVDADVLLHVVDASDPEHPRHIQAVASVLDGLGLLDLPRLLVFNKCDLLTGSVDGLAARTLVRDRRAAAVSARTGEGLAEMLSRIEQLLWREGKALAPAGAPRDAGHAVP